MEFIERTFQFQSINTLQWALRTGWGVFAALGVMASAYCFSVLFLPPDAEFPLGLWHFLGAIVLLRLLLLLLSSLHQQMAQHSDLPVSKKPFHLLWALRLTPGKPELYCLWGDLALSQGDAENAYQRYEAARQLNPANPEVYTALGSWALAQRQWQAACRYFETGYRLRRGVAWNELPEKIPDETPVEPVAQATTVSLSKLRHDLEQLTFLLQGNYLSSSFVPLQKAYQQLLKSYQTQGSQGQQGQQVQLSAAEHAQIYLVHERNYFVAPVPAFPRRVLSESWQAQQVEQAYFDSQPQMVVIDQLLQPDALEALLHFCQKSSIWHADKAGGYLGAYMADGFNCELLYQVVEELMASLPEIFRGLSLKQMWAYKYDSRRQGIGIHADGAKVNLNFWLTPDSANLDPQSGGLRIYHARAPESWQFKDYNQDTAKTQAYLEQTQAGFTEVAYRQNRAILFDSRLFHATAPFEFVDEYLLRRINVTLLFA